MHRRPIALSWSGGKDSALALHTLLRDRSVDVASLVTTVTSEYDRVSMHGVRTALLEEQAMVLGLPLHVVRIPPAATNAQYERATCEALQALRQQGIAAMAFGDLFLTDVREYRERLVGDTGIEALFPIWGRATDPLARRFVRDGFRAVLVCVDPRQIDVSHCGADFDDALLEALPASADPCGENGEFHTFVYDAPMFERPIRTRRGEVVEKSGFVFCDLLPPDAAGASSGDAVRDGMPSA
jgi:uncharacterized protein (TIGR00290 family)